jgi:UDP-N-acetylmuramate--alanine ligase
LLRLRLPGRHNVLNALAVLVVTDWLGIPFADVRRALGDFHGVGRRFEVKGEAGGVTVVDDYAHHPTKIRVTLAAARERYPGRRIWAVFQPHTYSRIRALQADFCAAFNAADELVVLDIYAARENDNLGVSAAGLAAQIQGPPTKYIGDRVQAAAYLADHLETGDVLITLGAGDGYMVGEWVLDALRSQSEEE